jgi:hypothetical protein
MATYGFKIPGTTYNVSSTSLLGTPNITLMPILTCDPTRNLAEHQYLNAACYSFPTQVGQNGPIMQPVVYGPAYFNTDLSLRKNFIIKETRALRLSLDTYNPFNHPLWSFNGNSNLTLGVQWHDRRSQYAAFRLRYRQTGTSDRAGRPHVQVLMFISLQGSQIEGAAPDDALCS